jgi:hypothetical protein
MRFKLLEPHVIGDRWLPRGAVVEDAVATPRMEGLDDEGREAVTYAQLKAWGRYSWPYGLYPPGYGGAQPLDSPPIPRPLDDNQPVYHYTGSKEYLS